MTLYQVLCYTVSVGQKIRFTDYQQAVTSQEAVEKSKEKYKLHKYGVTVEYARRSK